MRISGIYKIINRVNEKYYIGGSNNVRHRWSRHRSQLNHNKHPNSHLQNAWNKYGAENFSFVLVSEIPNNLLLVEEQKILSGLVLRNTYNICPDAIAPMTGRHHTDNAKLKISKAQIGRTVSIERRKQQSQMMVGKFVGSKNPMFGKQHSIETRSKMGTPDTTIFHFTNLFTSEKYIGIRRDFGLKYGIKKNCIWNLVHGKVKTCKGWMCS